MTYQQWQANNISTNMLTLSLVFPETYEHMLLYAVVQALALSTTMQFDLTNSTPCKAEGL